MVSIFSLLLFSYSCRDTETKPDTVVVEKDVVHEVKVEDEDKSLLEQAASEVDKEVKEEVSEEIDKIGDDN